MQPIWVRAHPLNVGCQPSVHPSSSNFQAAPCFLISHSRVFRRGSFSALLNCGSLILPTHDLRHSVTPDVCLLAV